VQKNLTWRIKNFGGASGMRQGIGEKVRAGLISQILNLIPESVEMTDED